MTKLASFLALFACLSYGQSSAQSNDQQSWEVALTFDDIPMSGGANCDRSQIESVNDRILATLDRHAVDATGFVVAGAACRGDANASPAALATRWRDAGHAIGNHSFSHQDYNSQTAQAYLHDASRAHAVLEPILQQSSQSDRWFRPPMLHTGPDRHRRVALEEWLARQGHRMGVVTIDNQEWVYAAAYQVALQGGDTALADKVALAYVAHILETADYSRALARSLFGREIAQVLLLHANVLNRDHLEALLAALEQTGARFVSLSEATADSAYQADDGYIGPRGLSWLQRWALTRGVTPPAEPRETEWVHSLANGG